MNINSRFYNHYHIENRYTPETPQIPGWKKDYAEKTDVIECSNSNKKDDSFKAYTILEETYYHLGVANRAKYETVAEVKHALQDKYLSRTSIYYNKYTKPERRAMYENELGMTLFGCLGGGGHVGDPHIKGPVRTQSHAEKQRYNRFMVTKQINSIFNKNGIIGGIGNKDIRFTIDPLNYKLKVSGIDEKSVIDKIEEVLNKDRNSIELFYHILKNTSSSIPLEVKNKFEMMNMFKNVTGKDVRDYIQYADGFYNSEGENMLDVYNEYLKTSDIPYKGAASQFFEETVKKNLMNKFSEVPDLYLGIGYKNGELYDIALPDVQEKYIDLKI